MVRHNNETIALETTYFEKLNRAIIMRWKAKLQNTWPLMIISISMNKNPIFLCHVLQNLLTNLHVLALYGP